MIHRRKGPPFHDWIIWGVVDYLCKVKRTLHIYGSPTQAVREIENERGKGEDRGGRERRVKQRQTETG